MQKYIIDYIFLQKELNEKSSIVTEYQIDGVLWERSIGKTDNDRNKKISPFAVPPFAVPRLGRHPNPGHAEKETSNVRKIRFGFNTKTKINIRGASRLTHLLVNLKWIGKRIPENIQLLGIDHFEHFIIVSANFKKFIKI